ncbi:MAG: PilN domain-containing protein [Candidatus Moranbacteria bacterium]|nr:PilN domain-containing protein [Candidatus Moranbacteria bacterium]
MKISLDLLPQNKKAKIKRDKLFGEIINEGILFLFPFFVLIVILFNVFYLLTIQKKINDSEYEIQQRQNEYQELNKYDKDFKQMNETAVLLVKIQAGHLRWVDIFSHLSQDTPQGVVLESFANKDYSVFLVGKAKTRDQLLQFKENLEKDSCFGNVNVPLSNLVVKDNVDFQLDFVVKKECLKAQ